MERVDLPPVVPCSPSLEVGVVGVEDPQEKKKQGEVVMVAREREPRRKVVGMTCTRYKRDICHR